MHAYPVRFIIQCSIPHGAMGLSAVCDCGISLSYSLTIFLDYSNGKMASTARSHVEGVVMVFCSIWWLIRVCGEI